MSPSRLKSTVIAAALVSLVALAGPAAQAASIERWKDFYPVAASGDGSVIAGISGDRAIVWSQIWGSEYLGDLPGEGSQSAALGISEDGQVVVGWVHHYVGGVWRTEAFRWTRAGGMKGLGFLPGLTDKSWATAASADGSLVVGTSQYEKASEAFIWSEAGGMRGLGYLPGGTSSVANGISGDGSLVVGCGWGQVLPKAFYWREAEGMVALPDLPDPHTAQAMAVSADGKVIVGFAHTWSEPYWRVVRWPLGRPPQALGEAVMCRNIFFEDITCQSAHWFYDPLNEAIGFYGALGISGDGSVIVGMSNFPAVGAQAFIWDAAHGLRKLSDVLAANYGLNLAPATVTAISADGATILGWGSTTEDDWSVSLGCENPQEVAAIAGGDVTIQAGAEAILDGSGSTGGPDGRPIVSYKWVVKQGPGVVVGPDDGPTVAIRASAGGIIRVRLTVGDGICNNLSQNGSESAEAQITATPDCNGNGVPDDLDINTGTSLDWNGNGIPDECEPDCNGNGVPDSHDTSTKTSPDCNGNGVPDECDIAAGTSKDLNGSGIPDECDPTEVVYQRDNIQDSYNYVPFGVDDVAGKPLPGDHLGNQITLAGSNRLLTRATVGFGAGTWFGSMDTHIDTYTAALYLNNGTGGSPGTKIAESSVDAETSGPPIFVNFPFSVIVPNTFTVVVSSSHPLDTYSSRVGIAGAQSALASPSVGSAVNTIWYNTNSEATKWVSNSTWAIQDGAETNYFWMVLEAAESPCIDYQESAVIAGSPTQTVQVGTVVTLNGRDSSPGQGNPYPLTYTWSIDSGPGAIVGRDDGATVRVKGTAAGSVVVKLVVDTAGEGCGPNVGTAIATIDYDCTDFQEEAKISGIPADLVQVGTVVTLDGSGSSGGEGNPGALTYKWSIASGPGTIAGSSTGATVRVNGSGEGTVSVTLNVDTVGEGCGPKVGTAEASITFGPPGGLRVPGDANGDANMDISDAIATLGFLFLGSPTKLPCGDGRSTDPGNISLLDWQPDGAIDISDAVAMLSFLFLGGQPHALAVPGAETRSCVRIVGCMDRCGQ